MPVTFLQPHTMGRTTGSGWQWWPLSISPFTRAQIPLISTISRCKFCCKYCKSFCLKSISKCYILFQVHVLSVLVHIQHFILLLFRIPFCCKSFVENELPRPTQRNSQMTGRELRHLLFSHHSTIVLLTALHSVVLLGSAGIPLHFGMSFCNPLKHIKLPYIRQQKTSIAFIWAI